MLNDNWFVFKTINELSERLASDILDVAKNAIKLNNSFKIVLTGGDSILNTYKILRNCESDWSKWHIYLGDERCLPSKDKDRNDYIINKVWLDNDLIPKNNINFIHTELGVDSGAIYYNSILNNVDYFDLTLLSMGEDGHIASLFPGHFHEENKSVVVERNSPKYPKERVSMSYLRLNRSKNVFKIINGISKQGSLDLWLKGQDLPISQVNGFNNKIYICKDALPTLKNRIFK
jgi:6-phosphogluconolactonase